MKKVQMHNQEHDHHRHIHTIVKQLCEPRSYRSVYHRANHDTHMPSIDIMNQIVELLRSILFPGYFGNPELKPETMPYYIGSSVDRVYSLLSDQIKRGFCFSCSEGEEIDCVECEKRAKDITMTFVERLPQIRQLLSTDVDAAFEGDPAAKSAGETIFCYPSIQILTNHRIAHELYTLDIPLIPRIISELAHSRTGIDIHPGATIGERFFIDHGTGVVIGETSEIGSNVRIYQGVTLGAKSFPVDAHGNPVKGIRRHPIVEDDVIIYAGATILGRIRIGKGSVIGGNVWVTRDVKPESRIMQQKFEEGLHEYGSGI